MSSSWARLSHDGAMKVMPTAAATQAKQISQGCCAVKRPRTLNMPNVSRVAQGCARRNRMVKKHLIFIGGKASGDTGKMRNWPDEGGCEKMGGIHCAVGGLFPWGWFCAGVATPRRHNDGPAKSWPRQSKQMTHAWP